MKDWSALAAASGLEIKGLVLRHGSWCRLTPMGHRLAAMVDDQVSVRSAADREG